MNGYAIDREIDRNGEELLKIFHRAWKNEAGQGLCIFDADNYFNDRCELVKAFMRHEGEPLFRFSWNHHLQTIGFEKQYQLSTLEKDTRQHAAIIYHDMGVTMGKAVRDTFMYFLKNKTSLWWESKPHILFYTQHSGQTIIFQAYFRVIANAFNK